MKFMMVFEGIDRASKVMAKIMSAEKKTAASVKAGSAASARGAEDAARATGRHAAALQRVGSIARGAYNSVVSGARAAGRAVGDLHRKTAALGKVGFGQIREGAGRAMRGTALAGGLLISVFGGAALAATHLTATGSQFEKFQTILETTEGSTAKAGKAMGWVSDFAAKTPYELDQVMDSFVRLRTTGLDPTQGLLTALGDTSAAMGKPLMQAVEAMGDAVTGENERLKEFGITASKTGNKIAYTYTNAAGKQMEASVKATDRMAIQMKLMEIFNEKYGGAMEKLSGTWDGMVSNLSDSWSRFQLMIMNAGLFDWMSNKLKMVLDMVNAMAANGTLQQWAQTISDRIVSVLETTWQFAQGVWSVLQRLGAGLSIAADAVGGWENLAVVLGSLAFGSTLVATAAGIVQIAYGLSLLSAALMANPVGLAIAAIVAGAALIYLNWGSIKAFFVDLWAAIGNGASQAWEAVKSAIGFDPVAALSAGWSQLSSTVSGWWDSIPTFEWSDILSVLEWGKFLTPFAWPSLPAFEWPKLPDLALPKLPDIAGWIGKFGDTAMEAIDKVSTRLGNAWTRVKSAFSFGGDAAATASITVTDPATIQAAAAATAALKTDMQAVAAINTGPAMAKLSELETAAKRVGASVTASIRQAQAYLANISFYNQGAALMDTMAAGIRARAAVVVNEIQKMAQQIRDHLPSSPAKVGPLSDIHRLKFGETIAASIRAEPMVKAMRAAAGATMAAAAMTASPVMATPASPDRAVAAREAVARASVQARPDAAPQPAGVHLTFAPVLHAKDGADLKSLQEDFDRMMRESTRKMADLIEEEQRRRARRDV